jgi:hypothetical protein
MIQAFLMWFPPCALFIAVVYITECAWLVKGNRDFDPAYRAALLLVPKSTRRAS